MRYGIILALLLVPSADVFADNMPATFASAKAAWQETNGTKDYQAYLSDFVQFNNHFHLDEKDGCYALGKEPVELMLVITHRDAGQYALIEKVYTSVDTPKAQCFKNTYEGLQTKIPPFLPFILQLGMG